MGVDLTLLPLLQRDFWVSHDIIRINQRSELWDAINKLPSHPVPGRLGCYFAQTPEGEVGYGDVTEDCYGDPLRWVTPADLLTLSDHELVRDNWQNCAVWAYLAEMPKDWPIVLWWH